MDHTPILSTVCVAQGEVPLYVVKLGMTQDLCVRKLNMLSTTTSQARRRTPVGGQKLTRTQVENNISTKIQELHFGQIQPKADSSISKEAARHQSAGKTQHPPKPCPIVHVSIPDADASSANPPFSPPIVL